MADLICIENLFKKYSLKEISVESEISYNTLKKMKYGQRDVLKLSLGDAIKLTSLWYKWEVKTQEEDEALINAKSSLFFDE